jgi:hypothetical protein
MSLQRIFESARKLGVPVIMTDPAGREPMVVLTLEQFEAIAGTATETAKESVQTNGRRGRPPGRRSAEASKSDDSMPPAEDTASRTEAIEPSFEDYPSQPEAEAEISLDERFYLEPLDDTKSA